MNRRSTSGISPKDGIRISHISKKFEEKHLLDGMMLDERVHFLKTESEGSCITASAWKQSEVFITV